EICRRYGYGRIETPVFEEAGLFVRTIGQGTDIVEKETYTFKDRSDQEMTLRPEGTAPVCRAYIEHGMHSLPQPVKLYYFASIFRYERPQKGRYRQHHQFGVEAIGEIDSALDSEVVEMAWNFYAMLGLNDIVLYINSIGCRECRPGYIKKLKKYYSSHIDEVCPQCKIRYERNPLRLLDCKEPACQGLADAAPKSDAALCPECKQHFKDVLANLKIVKVPFKKNHRLVRGLDYYTRTVFEIQPVAGGGQQSALGGGGRYDNLIEELGGKPAPAIGFAAGIDRIVMCMKEQGVEPPPSEDQGIYVAYMGEKAKAEAIRLTSEMRTAGIPVYIGYGGKSLKAQMRQANNLGVSFAFIFGEEEVQKGKVIYKDMAGGEQWEVEINEVISLLTQG
ncbi:MAG: histidine--tRNA ligase, partial [Dehalococcoidia bacterium]